jgi:hypothetical protein
MPDMLLQDVSEVLRKAIADLEAAGIAVPASLRLAVLLLAPAPRWTRLGEMWSAEQAEHALVAGYELTAFVIAADPAKGWAREIGWELHGGPKLLDLIAKGSADSFDDAKARGVAAWQAADDRSEP